MPKLTITDEERPVKLELIQDGDAVRLVARGGPVSDEQILLTVYADGTVYREFLDKEAAERLGFVVNADRRVWDESIDRHEGGQ